jgi:signal transduction protein with GAF and PtsI domain
MTGGATLSDRYLGYRTKRYGATCDGHDVELEFDKRRVVLNEARLVVDGEVVDKAKIFYGDKNLTATAQDGTEIVVAVDSGMVGELTRAQLRRADGSWIDLEEREPKS